MSEQPNTFEDPALLIVDMQNDFVRQDAPLQVPDALATVAAHQALMDLDPQNVPKFRDVVDLLSAEVSSDTPEGE